MFSFSRFGFKRRSRREKQEEALRVDESIELGPLLYFVGPSPVYLLPADMLTMQGAHRFNDRHPFVRCLAHGADALAAFYSGFSPANIAEMYRIHPDGMAGGNLAPWEVPWLRRERTPPPGEAGLSAEHGVSYYGPCTPQKVAVEAERLFSVTKSISANGYQPEVNGHIEGHFLQRGREFRFFVRGGKHRAAALTHLGFDRIPVRVRLTWPRVVMAGTEADWPLVANGEMDPKLASMVFDRYFDNDG